MADINDILIEEQITAQVFLYRLATVSDVQFSEALEQLRLDIADEIERSKTSTRVRLKQIDLQVQDRLGEIYGEYTPDLLDEKEIAAGIGYKANRRAFSSALGLSSTTWTNVPQAAIARIIALDNLIKVQSDDGRNLEVNLAKNIDNLFKDHSKAYTRTLRKALGLGFGIEETVSDFLATQGKIDGVKVNNIRSITRTAMNDAMSRAREYSEETNFKEVITGYQWISVFDNRTSPWCAGLAGTVRKRREDFPFGMPPIHIGCRSIVIAITDLTETKDYEARARWFDKKVGTSHGEIQTKFKLIKSSDKKITVENPALNSKFSSFDKWFGSLSQKRQVEYLGPQKYKLYKTGNLGMKQLVDGKGKIRTVEELAKLAGVDAEGLKEVRKRDISAIKPPITAGAKKIYQARKEAKEQ